MERRRAVQSGSVSFTDFQCVVRPNLGGSCPSGSVTCDGVRVPWSSEFRSHSVNRRGGLSEMTC